MITTIHSTTVVVADQDVSLDFYVNKLGWEKRIDNQMGPAYRFLTVAPPGAVTELVLGPVAIHGVLHREGGHVEPGAGTPTGISLTVQDLDETYRVLSARGVRFSKPPETMPWGDKATWMMDPDGNSFFLNELAKR